jgi:hypothetical protein
MQLDLAKHILGLIWKKYHLKKVLVGLFFITYLALFSTDWFEVEGRFDINLPFVDAVLPSLDLTLTGWKVMGYFAWVQLALLPIFLWNPIKKYAFAVTVTLMVSILIHLLQLDQLRNLVPTGSSLLMVEVKVNLPIYIYLASQVAFALFGYAVTNQADSIYPTRDSENKS